MFIWTNILSFNQNLLHYKASRQTIQWSCLLRIVKYTYCILLRGVKSPSQQGHLLAVGSDLQSLRTRSWWLSSLWLGCNILLWPLLGLMSNQRPDPINRLVISSPIPMSQSYSSNFSSDKQAPNLILGQIELFNQLVRIIIIIDYLKPCSCVQIICIWIMLNSNTWNH